VGKKVRRYSWHSAGSLGWPFPVLRCKCIFQIKYTDAILSNSTQKLLWFEISKMLIAVFGALSYPAVGRRIYSQEIVSWTFDPLPWHGCVLTLGKLFTPMRLDADGLRCYVEPLTCITLPVKTELNSSSGRALFSGSVRSLPTSSA